MLNPSLKAAMAILMICSLSLSCKKKEDDQDSGLGYQIPRITDPVGMLRGASVNSSTTSLKLNDSNAWTTCSNAGHCGNSGAAQMFVMGSNFVVLGAAADLYTCFAQSLVNGRDLPTDGTALVLTDSGGFKVRMKATVTGDALSSYSIQVCEGGATQNAQYTAGTLGADGTTSIQLKLDGTRWVSHAGTNLTTFTISGNYSGGIWNNKQLTVEDKNPGPIYSKYVITQGSDNLVIQGAGSSGSWQVYGKFKLLGSSSNDYAFDAGSALTPGPTTSSWNSNGDTGGSMYLSDVQSGQMLTVPNSYTSGMSGSENWNCQTGSEKSMSFDSVSDLTAKGLASCMQQQ